MKKPTVLSRVVRDMFAVQMSWALWLLAALVIINIVKIARAVIQEGAVDHTFAAMVIPVAIFMLVIGMISVHFLPHYVSAGVTRTTYFRGTLFAALGISAVIPIIAVGFYALEHWIFRFFTNFSFRATDVNAIILDIDSHIVSDVILSIILIPYVDPGTNWVLAAALLSVNMFSYYVIGWFVSVCFYRFDTIAGVGFMLVALLMLMLQDTLLRIVLDVPVLQRFALLEDLPFAAAGVCFLLLLVMVAAGIRLFTRKIPIRL